MMISSTFELKDYLFRRNAFETLCSILLETNVPVPLPSYDIVDANAPWLVYLQRLILQGRWEDVDNYMKPFYSDEANIERNVRLRRSICRQMYLEVLSWQGGGGQRMSFPPWQLIALVKPEKDEAVLDKLLSYLNQLQSLCSQEEFSALCTCLTLDRLDQHPLFSDWTVSQGRIQCFLEIREALLFTKGGVGVQSHQSSESDSSGLLRLISSALSHQLNDHQDKSHDIVRAALDPKTLYLVPMHGSQRHKREEDSKVKFCKEVSYLRRFDQRPPFEGPTVPTRSRATAVSDNSTGERASDSRAGEGPSRHVFDFVPVRQKDQGDGGVAESKQDDFSRMENAVSNPSNIDKDRDRDHGHPARLEETVPFPIKAPRRPAPIPLGLEGNEGEEALQRSPRPVPSPGPAPSQSNTDKEERKEEPIPLARDSSREAVSFFVDMAPAGAKPRSASAMSRFSSASRERGERTPRGSKDVTPERPQPVSAKAAIPAAASQSDRDPAAGARHGRREDLSEEDQTKHVRSAKSSLSEPSASEAGAAGSSSSSSRVRVKDNPLFSPPRLPPAAEGPRQPERARNPFSLPTEDPRALQEPSFSPVPVPSPVLLYQTDCPLRCVRVLSGRQDFPSGLWEHSFAVGTNSKSIHTFTVSERSVLAAVEGQQGLGKWRRGGLLSAEAAVTREKEFVNIHKGSVYALDWLESQQLLASGSNDKTLKLCNISSGSVSSALKGHNGTIRVVRFGGNSNPRLASAGAGDCKPRLWDVQTGSCLSELSAHPDAVHGLFWMDANLVVSGCDKGRVIGHDLRTDSSASSKIAWQHQLSRAAGGEGVAVCCLSGVPGEAGLVAAGCAQGWLQLLDVRSGRRLCEQRLHSDDIRSLSLLPLAQSRPRSTARSLLVPDSDSEGGSWSWALLTSSYDGTAALWRQAAGAGAEGKCEQVFSLSGGHADKVLCASFAAGGDTTLSELRLDLSRPPAILTSGADGRVLLWQSA